MVSPSLKRPERISTERGSSISLKLLIFLGGLVHDMIIGEHDDGGMDFERLGQNNGPFPADLLAA